MKMALGSLSAVTTQCLCSLSKKVRRRLKGRRKRCQYDNDFWSRTVIETWAPGTQHPPLPPPLRHILREVKPVTIYFLRSFAVAAASALSCFLLKRGLQQDTYVVSNSLLLSVEDDVSCYQVTENITRSVRQWGETEEEGTDQGLLLHCHQCLAAFNYPCVAPHLCCC